MRTHEGKKIIKDKSKDKNLNKSMLRVEGLTLKFRSNMS